MALVDSHTHFLPGRLAEKVRAFFEQGGPLGLAYPLDHGEVAEQVAAEGVTTVWSLPYAHRAGVAPWLNDESAALLRRSLAVDVVAGATVHPDDADPAGELRRAVEDGGLRVLKLHCSVGGYDATDARLAPVWDYVEAVAVPVVVHVGHAVGGTTEADELTAIGEVARRHPEARIVIAHCGHRAVTAALDLLRAHPNVHADLTPVVHEPVAISPAAAQELSHKLLFGTDTPNTTLSVSACLAHLDSLGLTDDARAAVTGGNARQLIGAVAR